MKPLDRQVDAAINPDQRPVRRIEHVTAYLPRMTVTRRYRDLSATQDAVRKTIERFGMATSSQLRRLHYSGTQRGTRVRSADHLKKLSERGVIRRIPYKLNSEYAYAPKDSKARVSNLHTLDITELYVRLWEAVGATLRFDPEPWAPTTWGGRPVTPDAYVRLPQVHHYVEIDRSSESPSVISTKMSRYVRALHASYVDDDKPAATFPQVIWLAHDTDRVRTLSRQAKLKAEPDLFVCLLFDEGTQIMTR